MANRKTNSRNKPRRVKRMLSWRGLLRFLMMRPVRYLVLVVIVVVVFLWQSATLDSWADNIWNLFGWGLILIAIAIGGLVWLTWRRKLSSLIYRWNQWLACIACIFAAWGILALFELGGDFGITIIGDTEWAGVLRILGLFVISVILVAPRIFFQPVVKLFSQIGRRPERQATPRPTRKQEVSFPTVTPTRKSPEAEPETKTVAPAPVPATTPTSKELRQIAQEVWKKYGESSKTVTIDGGGCRPSIFWMIRWRQSSVKPTI